MIAQQILNGPNTIFTTLVPVLLGLATLPSVPGFQEPVAPASPPDFNIIDLALTTLTFMGRRGPAGTLLAQARQDFTPYLSQLARYSLESYTLLTPTAIPLSDKNYSEYESVITRWIPLRDKCSKPKYLLKENEIEACRKILQDLLTCAEEVRYPSYYSLLKMCATSENRSDWQQCWQEYILATLQEGKYIDYQQLAVFWTMLFPKPEEMEKLAEKVLDNFNSREQHLRRNAQRFISTVASDLRYLRDLRDLRYLRDLLLSQEVAENAIKLITTSNDVQHTDLLVILLGRVLYLWEDSDERNIAMQEPEIKHIVQVAGHSFFSAQNDDVQEAALDVLRYLPVRTASEIIYVIRCAEATPDEQLQQAYAASLQRADAGNNHERAKALQTGKGSSVQAVRKAVGYVVERKR